MDDKSTIPSFRALILEDHDFQRRVGSQLLRNCGAVHVFEAPDVATALTHLDTATEPIEILLCDLNMPGTDGLAFLRHIAEQKSKISVILASALEASIVRAAEQMAKSYGIQILGIVEKPISRDKLMPLLRRHFTQGTARADAVDLLPPDEIEAGIVLGQFTPFFQPKVEIKTGRLVGAEVLMRWHHPERGMVPPSAFIPVMERHGQITRATFTILEEALAWCRKWRDAGLEMSIAVNISVESLSDTNLPDRFEALTQKAGLPTHALIIEITETVAMTDLGRALETLTRCRMKGFLLSIDDYGTGFSSMQQLTRLPLSELKIDQSFVTGAARNQILQTLIETSITMANRLELKTVAEGVETAEDLELVASLGCQIAQGYFIARPMPGDQLAGWLENQKGR